MTRNQIAYHQLEETKRSNRENEDIKRDTLAEQKYHNRRSEVADMMSATGSLARGFSGFAGKGASAVGKASSKTPTAFNAAKYL